MSVGLGATITADALKSRTFWVFHASALVAAAVLGTIERSRDPAYATDRTLLGATFGFLAPLLFLATFEIVHRRAKTSAVVAPLARHGGSRRALALGVLGALAVACAVAGASLGLVAAAASGASGEAGFWADLYASTWGGAVIGGAYAGLYAVGSLVGRWGRILALLFDWVLGSGAGYLSLAFPRASARNLLGGEPALDAPQLVALVVLLGLTLAGVLASAVRRAS
jgi:hypothetical protein